MLVTYDPEANATYVRLSGAPVASTQQFGDSLAVDVDSAGEPVGVELLMAPTAVTDTVLAPLLATHPELAAVSDVLHHLNLPATA